MNILFVENRYKTAFWEAIALELEKAGHTIYWIVQNHSFTPKNFKNIYIIPYFQGQLKDVNKNYTSAIKKIILSDRGVNFYGIKSDNHFFYYNNYIEKIIADIQPDVAFGESTLMHELLVMENCRSRKIPFFHPCSVRYPVDRFSFYKYDTLFPSQGSNEEIEDTKALEIINAIVNRIAKPYYMGFETISYQERIKDKVKILFAHICGERFNTPSLFRKFSLTQSLKIKINSWEKLAVNNIETDNRFKILFPLHMQPESSVDVFATDYINQTELIKGIADSLTGDETLYLKPNPKPSQEFTQELITLISEHEKIKVLTQKSLMKNIFKKVDLIITIAGTVAMEAILANKPVVVFCDGLLFESSNCFKISIPSEINDIIEIIKSKKFPILEDNEKINYLNKINKSSFEGFIGDGFEGKIFLKDSCNLKKVVDAFKQTISKI